MQQSPAIFAIRSLTPGGIGADVGRSGHLGAQRYPLGSSILVLRSFQEAMDKIDMADPTGNRSTPAGHRHDAVREIAQRVSVRRAGEADTTRLSRLSVQFLLERIDQPLIVGAYPEISIPSDGANPRWSRCIMLLERSELLSVPRRDEKFHRSSLLIGHHEKGGGYVEPLRLFVQGELRIPRIKAAPLHAKASFWPEYVHSFED